MSLIRYKAKAEFGDKESVLAAVDRAQKLIQELRQLMYTIESKGVTIVMEETPTDGKSDGVSEDQV